VYVEQCLTPLRAKLRAKKELHRRLMQDGASPHTCKSTREWMTNQSVSVVDGWPAHSPDLNPIETLWAWLQIEVGTRGPKDEAALRQFIAEEWDKLPQARIDSLVLEYTERLRECKAAKGGSF
jgi:transposase